MYVSFSQSAGRFPAVEKRVATVLPRLPKSLPEETEPPMLDIRCLSVVLAATLLTLVATISPAPLAAAGKKGVAGDAPIGAGSSGRLNNQSGSASKLRCYGSGCRHLGDRVLPSGGVYEVKPLRRHPGGGDWTPSSK